MGKNGLFGDEYAVAAVLAAVHAAGVVLVNSILQEPYMDEIFHIRQTRKYCAGDYTWDPMITTPPLLYFLAMPLCHGQERFLNSILYPLTFLGCCRLRRLFVGAGDPIILPALSVVLTPVLLHSSLLFYTDLLSLCIVVWALSSSSILCSSLLFGISLLCRQTNIIWAGLYAVVILIRRFRPTRPLSSLLRAVASLWPFLLLGVSFLLFVFLNGGIVLGDPSAHQPQIHLAQILYLSVFCCFSASFSLLPYAYDIFRCLFRPRSLILLPIIVLVIEYFSLSHPYLLADNRHVPFYLWRWLLSKALSRLCLAPLYLISLLSMSHLSSSIAPSLRLLFALGSMAVVVPAHLIEPRYFIVPFALWRLSAHTHAKFLGLLEVIFQLVVFSPLFYLFLFKPFEWAHEPGKLQRFMW